MPFEISINNPVMLRELSMIPRNENVPLKNCSDRDYHNDCCNGFIMSGENYYSIGGKKICVDCFAKKTFNEMLFEMSRNNNAI